MRAKIIGTGAYVPLKILTNRDLEKQVETTDRWIVDRTGIRERHIAVRRRRSQCRFSGNMIFAVSTASI